MRDKILWRLLRKFEQASIALALTLDTENYSREQEKQEYDKARKNLLDYIEELKHTHALVWDIGGEG